MKKYFSILMALVISMSSLLLPGVSYAKKDINFFVTESFNDTPTGAVPGNGAVAAGTCKVVVTEPGKDKAVEMSKSKSESSFYYKFETNENYVSIFADLTYTDDWTYTGFNIYDSAYKAQTVAYIDSNGEICSGDTRMNRKIPKGIKTSVQMTYSKKYQKVWLYVNGKSVISTRFMGASSYEDIFGLGIKATGKDNASLLADNVAVFEGKDVIKSSQVPKKAFNPESFVASSEGEEGNEDEFVGETIYTNRTFDEEGVPEFDGFTLSSVGGNKALIDRSVFDGNKYAKLKKVCDDKMIVHMKGNQTARYVVFEADFSTDTNTPAGYLVYARDEKAASMFCQFVNVDSSGNLTANKQTIGKIERLKWTKVGVLFDTQTLTYSVYINGELKVDKAPFANKTMTGLPILRIEIKNGAGTGDLLTDNVRIYEGKDFRDLSKVETKRSIVTPDSVAQGYLGTMKAISPYSGHLYADKVKSNSKKPIIQENDETVIYACSEDLKTLFGPSVKLTGAHLTEPDYYNILETASANGYYTTNFDTRIFVFNQTPVSFTEAQFMEIDRYLYFVRPSASELVELFNTINKNEHPRLLVNKDELERIKQLYKTDPHMKEWGDNTIEHANGLFGKKEYQYRITGSSMDDVNYAIDDILCICMAYHLTGNKRYAARGWTFIENICKLKDWNPGGYLDVGELSYVVGLGYDWLYDTLNDEQKKFIEETLLRLGVGLTDRLYKGQLKEGVDGYIGWWDSKNNWNSVCNGGTMLGAIAIFDKYPTQCSELIENANRALEYMVQSYYPRGAWEEGSGYWNYALSYLVRLAMTFKNVFGTDFNMIHYPGINYTGWYGTYLSGTRQMFGLGDGGGDFINNKHIMYLANIYNDKVLMALRMMQMEKCNFKGNANEMIYYNPDLLGGEVTLPLDTYVTTMEVIGLRESWYVPGDTSVGMTGGSNNRGHGHMDIGAFQVQMAGENFICDSGAEDYNAKGGYFTSNRYYFYRARPEGHNLYVINKQDTLEDFGMLKKASAKGQLGISKPRGATATMDLSEPYAEQAYSALRGIMLGDDRRTVTVRDEIELKNPDSEVYYFMHTMAKVESIQGNEAVLSLNGKKMRVRINTNADQWELMEMEAASMGTATKAKVSDTNNATKGLKKLAIKMKASGRLTITVKFTQYDDLMVNPDPDDIDIANWTIPDGEVTPLPYADMIYADGVPVEGFDPTVTGYSELVPTKQENIPQISVATSNRYEIIQSTDFGEDTIVKVYAPGSDTIFRTYRLNYHKLPPLKDVDGLRRYPVAEITVSDYPQEENGPTNVIDNDYATRWAAEGDFGQWITLELDDVYPIEKVGVSWMNGDARTETYKLEISVDGQNWTEIFNGVSSGKTIKPEYTQTGGQRAKYVRCTGYGNSASKWNSVTEFVVLGNQR